MRGAWMWGLCGTMRGEEAELEAWFAPMREGSFCFDCNGAR
jgi:hypothetical protein